MQSKTTLDEIGQSPTTNSDEIARAWIMMDAYLRELVAAVPTAPPRSKLEPYYDVIRELRRKRCTYHQVATFFTERLGIRVSPSTVHAFVAVRAKRGRKSPYELPPIDSPAEAEALAEPVEVSDPIAEMKARRPAASPQPPRFEFNAEEPLQLSATNKKGFQE